MQNEKILIPSEEMAALTARALAALKTVAHQVENHLFLAPEEVTWEHVGLYEAMIHTMEKAADMAIVKLKNPSPALTENAEANRLKKPSDAQRIAVLKRHGWNVADSAKDLGINQAQDHDKIETSTEGWAIIALPNMEPGYQAHPEGDIFRALGDAANRGCGTANVLVRGLSEEEARVLMRALYNSSAPVDLAIAKGGSK